MPMGSKTSDNTAFQHLSATLPRLQVPTLQSDLTAYRATWHGIKCMQLVPKLGIMVELLQ